MDIIRRDLKDLDTTWDEAEELTTDGAEWSQRVAPNAAISMQEELR